MSFTTEKNCYKTISHKANLSELVNLEKLIPLGAKLRSLKCHSPHKERCFAKAQMSKISLYRKSESDYAFVVGMKKQLFSATGFQLFVEIKQIY